MYANNFSNTDLGGFDAVSDVLIFIGHSERDCAKVNAFIHFSHELCGTSQEERKMKELKGGIVAQWGCKSILVPVNAPTFFW